LHRPGASSAWIQDFELEGAGLHATNGAALEEQLNIAYTAVLAGELDSDGFHRLIVSAGLTVAQTRVLRACCRYLLQTGLPFSQAYMERVLHTHSHIARDLWRLFEQRLDPSADGRGAQRAATSIEQRLRHAIGEVRNPDDDRILRSFLAVVLATLRTKTISAATSCAGRWRSSCSRARSRACPNRGRNSRSSCTARTSKACTCAAG
jgi:glutamate dehydrogenase